MQDNLITESDKNKAVEKSQGNTVRTVDKSVSDTSGKSIKSQVPLNFGGYIKPNVKSLMCSRIQ